MRWRTFVTISNASRNRDATLADMHGDIEMVSFFYSSHYYSEIRYTIISFHDDVIKWKHFPRYWPFVRGIHRSPMNSPHKGQGGGALVFSLICVWIDGWVNDREADDLRGYRAHYDATVMSLNTEIYRYLPIWVRVWWMIYSEMTNLAISLRTFVHPRVTVSCHWQQKFRIYGTS